MRSPTVEIVRGCNECRFYRVSSEIMAAYCLAPGGPRGNYTVPLNTTAPYNRLLIAPKQCPLRTAPVVVNIEVRMAK